MRKNFNACATFYSNSPKLEKTTKNTLKRGFQGEGKGEGGMVGLPFCQRRHCDGHRHLCHALKTV